MQSAALQLCCASLVARRFGSLCRQLVPAAAPVCGHLHVPGSVWDWMYGQVMLLCVTLKTKAKQHPLALRSG